MRRSLLCSIALLSFSVAVPAQTVAVPPVVVSSFAHQHFVDPGPPQQTVTRDAVQFPCAPGNCNGPGFSASIGQGDTIHLRFEAPAGQRFVVARAAGGTQYFTAWAAWQTNTGDAISNFPVASITFDDLTGTAPTSTSMLNAVSNNGQTIVSENDFTVSGDFSFTAMNVQFVVGHALAHTLRTYNAVNSFSSPSFGSTRVVNGAASDATLIRLASTSVAIPPVVVSTLDHQHFVDAGPPLQTITMDAVQFPCAAGDCNGPGFSASIGQNSLVTLRYEAPTGYRFVVTRAPVGEQYFFAASYWSIGMVGTFSTNPAAAITFENLTGTAPVNSLAYSSVADNGESIVSESQFTVISSFSFTAMQVQFTVPQPLANHLRIYGTVNSPSSPSFGCLLAELGVSSDVTLMTIEPLSDSEAFCFGDGSDTSHLTACPCGNAGAAGNGCASSVNSAGASLAATGAASLDTITLHGSGMPASVVCIYIQQDARGDSVFGDGVSCAAGNLIRLRAKTNVGGASQFPDSSDTITVSQRGGVTPGSGVLRYYAAYYRNAAAGFCPPLTYNITNGWIVRW